MLAVRVTRRSRRTRSKEGGRIEEDEEHTHILYMRKPNKNKYNNFMK